MLVVILFLQTWRASIIPLIAVPVSVVGTFAALYLLGFSINTLTLFGLVLAIGIVVDDAIVVVENVERNIEEGRTPLEAAHQAMKEVSGPIVAIALVLCAVFVPMAFLTGVTGHFYKQFAVTIAISTVISAINSLTLSPALAAKLLQKPRRTEGYPFATGSSVCLAGCSDRSTASSRRAPDNYQGTVSRASRRSRCGVRRLRVLLLGTGLMFQRRAAWLYPDSGQAVSDRRREIAGRGLARTHRYRAAKVVEISKSVDDIAHVVAMTGLNPLQFTNTPNYGIAFLILKPFNERHRSAKEISDEINQKIAKIKEGMTFVLMPPPILGLGNGAGYSLFVEDRAGLGFGALQNAVNALQGAVMQTPGMGFPITGYQSNVPQLDVEVNRMKTKAQGIALTELFNTLQVYLGSAYVNDFNLFGRTWRIYAQADGDFRGEVEDIANLKTRNDRGEMVPIGSLVKLAQPTAPIRCCATTAIRPPTIIGEADPTMLSSAQAMDNIARSRQRCCPTA